MLERAARRARSSRAAATRSSSRAWRCRRSARSSRATRSPASTRCRRPRGRRAEAAPSDERQRQPRRGREPQGLVPDQERDRARPPRRRRQARSTTSPSRSGAARRSASSASPAAGSPRSAARSSACTSRPAGGSSSTARTSPSSARASCGRCGAGCRSSSRIRSRRSTRGTASAGSSASRCACTASPSGRRTGARVRELLEIVGLPADAATRYPHEFSRRPAPAHRPRPRARRQPGLRRRRRAGVGARRLDPGADHQPARGAADRVRPHLPVHRPRPRRRPAHLRPDRGHVPRLDRRGLAGGRAVRQPAAPVHDLAALGGADPRPGGRAQARADPPPGRPAEPGEPAAGLPLPHALPRTSSRRAAATRCPRCARSTPGHLVACHWAEKIKAGEIQPQVREPVFERAEPVAAAEPARDFRRRRDSEKTSHCTVARRPRTATSPCYGDHIASSPDGGARASAPSPRKRPSAGARCRVAPGSRHGSRAGERDPRRVAVRDVAKLRVALQDVEPHPGREVARPVPVRVRADPRDRGRVPLRRER